MINASAVRLAGATVRTVTLRRASRLLEAACGIYRPYAGSEPDAWLVSCQDHQHIGIPRIVQSERLVHMHIPAAHINAGRMNAQK